MKPLFILLLFIASNAFADNVQIPTCDLKKNDELYKTLSTEELIKKSNTFLHRVENCNSATSYLEIFNRGVAPGHKKELFNKLFGVLKNGKYLNEFTGLLLGLKHEIKHMDLEKISQDHAWMYTKFVKNKGTNPLSQFTLAGKHLRLLDEAEINFKLFIWNYPKNPFSQKLKKVIAQIHDQNIQAEIDYINYYRKNKRLDSTLMTVEVKKLTKILSKSSDSKYMLAGLNLVHDLIPETTFSASQKSQVQIEIKNVVANNEWNISTTKFYKIINPEEHNRMNLSQSELMNEFLTQKGDDRTIFLPLNKKFKLRATQTLVGLGVVGILIAFDEPIMDVVQKNKDTGILDEVAKYGNHFGEVGGLAPVILGTLGYGLVFNNDKAKNAAISSIGAIILGQLVIETLKSATHRSRPEDGVGAFDFKGFGLGSDNTSFGSGHSAAAWSVASVFAEEYGDEYKWAPVVAYSLAALTSYSRMNKNKHWASDVVVGAMVGYVAGKVFHKIFRKTFKNSLENVHVTPMIGRTTGLRIQISERIYADLKRWPLDTFYHYQKSVSELINKDSKGLEAIYEEIYLN